LLTFDTLASSPKDYKDYSGVWQPVFSHNAYTVRNGLVTQRKSTGNINKLSTDQVSRLKVW
jgi:hypothetical protein